MTKLIKYEIKGTYKVVLAILAIVIMSTTVLYTYIAKNEGSPIIALASMIMFGAFLVAFFYIVGSFRKELYEDRGYLTFSLPLTGRQILGAKLIVALLWFALLGFVTTFYNFFAMLRMAMKKTGLTYTKAIEELRWALAYIDIKTAILTGITLLVSGVSVLILIYFSMTLSRVTLRNKKIGGMWFVIFLVLSGLVAYLNLKVILTFPIYLDLTNWQLISLGIGETSQHSAGFMMAGNEGLFFIIDSIIYINIIGLLYNLIVGIALFLATGYLIENKIDL